MLFLPLFCIFLIFIDKGKNHEVRSRRVCCRQGFKCFLSKNKKGGITQIKALHCQSKYPQSPSCIHSLLPWHPSVYLPYCCWFKSKYCESQSLLRLIWVWIFSRLSLLFICFSSVLGYTFCTQTHQWIQLYFLKNKSYVSPCHKIFSTHLLPGPGRSECFPLLLHAFS